MNENMENEEEQKDFPEPIKNLGKFTEEIFTYEPHGRRIISSVFEGQRNENDYNLETELRFVSTAPVLEAVSSKMQELYGDAFNEKGDMINYDKVLDIHGLLLFTLDIYNSAEKAGEQINQQNLESLEDALSDLNKFIEQDPYS